MRLIAKLFEKDSRKSKRSYYSDELFFRFNELAAEYAKSEGGIKACAADNTKPSANSDDYSLTFVFTGELDNGRKYVLNLFRDCHVHGTERYERKSMELSLLLDDGWTSPNFRIIDLEIDGIKYSNPMGRAPKRIINDIKQKAPYLFETAYKPKIKGRGQSLEQKLPFIE